MHLDLRAIATWGRDLAVAYAGGLVLGAPIALLAVAATNRRFAATICLVAVMAAIFVIVRRRAAQRRQDQEPGLPAGTPQAQSMARRRVA